MSSSKTSIVDKIGHISWVTHGINWTHRTSGMKGKRMQMPDRKITKEKTSCRADDRMITRCERADCIHLAQEDGQG
jgi:hypothetical protein